MNDLSLLTSDPVSFFGLPEGFDRRDLKRAYGKAIRIYKPETHAAEFGRVREAYERLEKMLRYGKQQQQLVSAADAWKDSTGVPSADIDAAQATGTHDSAPPSEQSRQLPQSTPLSLRQLAVVDPGAALRQLQTQPRRTPPDYFLAAILSDVTAGRPSTKYLAHLIEGLTAYPADPGLLNLTTEYLRTEVSDAMLEKIVRYIAEKLRSPLFYLLTESLWLRLIEQVPFATFASLLAECERSVRQTEPSVNTTFHLRILRSAVWTAPPAWSNRVLGEIEMETAALNLNAEAELDFISRIQEVLQLEANHSSNHPVRRKLLGVLRLSCRREDASSTAAMLKTLHEIARDSTSLQQAFPMTTALDDNAWVMLIYALVEQLQLALDEPGEIPQERLTVQTQRLVSDLAVPAQKVYAPFGRAESRYQFWPLVAWMVSGMTIGLMPILVVTVMATDSAGQLSLWLVLLECAVLFIALYLSFRRWLYPRYLRPKMLQQQQKWTMQAYAKWWRGRLFRYAGSVGEAVPMLVARIGLTTQARGVAEMGNVVAHFAHQDAGLRIYAILQTLQR
ncbi:hypothetical protein [Allorhodopirellula heiligendammensis]|uniref:J domain-containing protein n=1 Tax=Allorhodopirellula heiligendammensis TaxID=2714739 RepID=A0A5C6BWM1_9BACT|nr:hypothetical protein [Allorhodopirellula heiligendammensis]TWU16368.1 hypothetical protein Poly21_35730 [Allorhodopirellula heiligendammensis]